MQHAAYSALSEARECLSRVQRILISTPETGARPMHSIPLALDMALYMLDEELDELLSLSASSR